jgi:integrase
MYFFRAFLPQQGSSASGISRKREEVRISLRTKDSVLARHRALWANLLLERAPEMTDRNNLLGALKGIRTWTIDENGVSADGPEDTNDLMRVLKEFPDLPAMYRRRKVEEASPNEAALLMMETIRKRLAEDPPPQQASIEVPWPSTMPANPTRLSVAIERFRSSKEASAENSKRTAKDRSRLLNKLHDHIREALGDDPFLHEISTHHISAFLDATPVRRPGEATTAATSAPKTVIKKHSDLRSFFSFAHEEMQATLVDPTAGLVRRAKALRLAASKQGRHFDPFQTSQIASIFEPRKYLAFNRRADYFWAPLLGLHLGTRLKEVVTLDIEDVGLHSATGIWFIDVTPENAKNTNSVRRLPITTRLMELGFIDYVKRVKDLGATRLFPFDDPNTTTAKEQPSKNCSRHFGKYMDTLGLSDPDLVFHSFRHTVVQALQDNNTPLPDAMQITGHQAQDFAIRSGLMTASQAQSVHISTYTHADKARLNVEYPLERLKQHLDRSVRVDVDYGRLRIAATIVAEQTVQVSDGFKSGWSTLARRRNAELLARLG